MKGLDAYPCGKCIPCRVNHRRLWAHRIVLESLCHAESSFVTLTYAPEHLPPGGTLVPRDLVLFLKRLRHSVPLRYFAVGEYGDQSWRPHYHLCLFGVSPLIAPVACQKAWGMGMVDVGEVNAQSAQYIAGYTVKKITKDYRSQLGDRHPEFSRMSRRPGIGALAMPTVAASLTDYSGSALIAANGDVPSVLGHGRKLLPLGRYLRGKLREASGFETTGGQPAVEAARLAELQALRATVPNKEAYRAKFIDDPAIDRIEYIYNLKRKDKL